MERDSLRIGDVRLTVGDRVRLSGIVVTVLRFKLIGSGYVEWHVVFVRDDGIEIELSRQSLDNIGFQQVYLDFHDGVDVPHVRVRADNTVIYPDEIG